MLPTRPIRSQRVVKLLAFRPVMRVLAWLGYFHPLMLGPELFVDPDSQLAFRNGRRVPFESVADVRSDAGAF